MSRFIGQQFAMGFNYIPNAFISVKARVTYFKAGDFLKTVSPGSKKYAVAAIAIRSFNSRYTEFILPVMNL